MIKTTNFIKETIEILRNKGIMKHIETSYLWTSERRAFENDLNKVTFSFYISATHVGPKTRPNPPSNENGPQRVVDGCSRRRAAPSRVGTRYPHFASTRYASVFQKRQIRVSLEQNVHVRKT